MTGRWRRVLPVVATCSPFWVFGCGDAPPPLRFQPGRPSPSQLYPTGTPVYVTVSAPSRPVGNCTTLVSGFHELTLLAAGCGDGCTVEDTGVEDIEQPGSLRLAMTATTAGWRTLEVRVQDEREGLRSDAVELEFAAVDALEVTHMGASDPGTALPMLVGIEPEWCVLAEAVDGRPIDITNSPLDLRSLNASFSVTSYTGYNPGRCWDLRAEASGTGHVQITAADQVLDYFPTAVDENEIQEVHLHGLIEVGEFRVPLDEEAYWEGPEQPFIIPTEDDFPLHLLVRLVTTDGRTARGGANRFVSDGPVVQVWTPFRDDEQLLGLVLVGSNPPPATCVRATIGSGSVALPVYIDRQPGDVPDPCLSPLGGGGAGGAAP